MTNCFSLLPNSLLELCFQGLSFLELIKILPTCKRWKLLLDTSPECWKGKSIEISDSKTTSTLQRGIISSPYFYLCSSLSLKISTSNFTCSFFNLFYWKTFIKWINTKGKNNIKEFSIHINTIKIEYREKLPAFFNSFHLPNLEIFKIYHFNYDFYNYQVDLRSFLCGSPKIKDLCINQMVFKQDYSLGPVPFQLFSSPVYSTSLTSLKLVNVFSLSSETITAITELINLKSLTLCDYTSTKYNNPFIESKENSFVLPKILPLKKYPISLFPGYKLSSLTDLELSGTAVCLAPSFTSYFHPYPSNHEMKLKCLRLSDILYEYLGEESVLDFLQDKIFHEVEEFAFHSGPNEFIKKGEFLSSFQKLKQVDFNDLMFEYNLNFLSLMENTNSCSSLTTLKLSNQKGFNFTNPFVNLSSLCKFPSLETLELDTPQVSTRQLEKIGECSSSSLKTLTFHYHPYLSGYLKYLLPLKGKLQKLNIICKSIDLITEEDNKVLLELEEAGTIVENI